MPTVLILLTVVFLLMRVAPGDPITAALGARLPAKELEKRKEAAGYDKPILEQYVEYLGQVVDPRPRRVGDRQPLGPLDHRRERQRHARADPGRVHDHAARRHPARADGGPLPGRAVGHRRPPVRDRHLRVPGLLPRLPVPARRLGSSAGRRRAGPVRSSSSTSTRSTHFYLIDTLIAGDWSAFWDVPPAPRSCRRWCSA